MQRYERIAQVLQGLLLGIEDSRPELVSVCGFSATCGPFQGVPRLRSITYWDPYWGRLCRGTCMYTYARVLTAA